MAGENRVVLCQQCKNVCSCRITADISLTDPAPLRFPSVGTKKHSARFYKGGQKGTIPGHGTAAGPAQEEFPESRQRRQEENAGSPRPDSREEYGRLQHTASPSPCCSSHSHVTSVRMEQNSGGPDCADRLFRSRRPRTAGQEKETVPVFIKRGTKDFSWEPTPQGRPSD